MSSPKSKGSKRRVRALVRRGSESHKRARAAGPAPAPPEGSVCRICGAEYARRTWRRRPRTAPAAKARTARRGVVCPACSQVLREEALGSVVARGPFIGQNRDEIRRRIANVCRRAEHTQPERRLVSIRVEGSDLEVRTTSQKLAHRIGAELSKAFGGDVAYDWTDPDGTLRVVWKPKARPRASS